MIKLYVVLQKLGMAQHWHFVHVVLTDGVDCDSRCSLQEAAQIMSYIRQIFPVKTLKIIFIGVGVDYQAEQELLYLAKSGGDNSEYYHV